jgi:proton glutamate symport protein
MPNALRIWRWPLHWQILVGLVIGVGIGYALGRVAVAGIPQDTPPQQAGEVALALVKGTWAHLIFGLLGELFLNGLRLIIVPLVFSSIVLAVANLGGGKDFGRLGGKVLAYYMCTSMLAILLGLALVDVIQPGFNSNGVGILVDQNLDAFEAEQADLARRTEGRTGASFLDVFKAMLPPNLFKAAVEGELLGLIVVAMLVGFFLSRTDGEPGRVIMAFTQGVYDITLRITGLVLRLAPLGVLGLLAVTIAEQYAKLKPDARFAEFITGIATFAGVTLAALGLHFGVTMILILSLVARVNPFRHYHAMAPALMTAFSTASSSATLPVTIDCVERRAGVSNRTAGFVLPLGATVNMDGTALYECVAAVFICQAFGIELSFAQQFMIVIVALLTSVGVAGVPAASLVAIVVILQAVQNNLPRGVLPDGVLLVSGLGLLLVFDRPLDMCRTAVNIFSDSVGAVTIARMEGEKPLGSA